MVFPGLMMPVWIRPKFLFLLSLAFVLFPGSVAGATHQAGAEPRGWQAILLRPEALAKRVGVAEVTPETLRGVEAAWLWTEQCPPRRLSGEELRRRFDEGGIAGCETDPGVLSVSLPGDGERAPGEVVAAPAAMWREVPEAWLPHWSVPRRGPLTLPRTVAEPWRLRYLGRGMGTWARDVPAGRSTAALEPVAASDLAAQAISATGDEVVPEATLTLFEGVEGGARPEVMSVHRADSKGFLRIPALPAERAATFVLGAAGHAPRAYRGRARDLPARLALAPAVSLRGRFLDPDGVPIRGVEVSVEGWVAEDVPLGFRRRSTSEEDGSWLLSDVPRRPALMSARRQGLAPFTRKFALDREEGMVEVGDVTLERGATLPVRVIDGEGVPVPGAQVSVERSPAPPVTMDERGVALLPGLVAGRALELSVSAPGFLARSVPVLVPWPEELQIGLTRGFTVRGRFVDPLGVPVVAGRVKVGTGSRFRYEDLSPDGGFDLLLEPLVEWSLELSSPSTRRRLVAVPAGRPGEVRELGDVMAQPGLAVFGTLLSAVDGAPVAGGRVWTPRASAGGGVLVSWLYDDLVEAESGEQGHFELAGLSPAPTRLYVEAPGFARTELEVAPEGDLLEIDAGLIELVPGATVLVTIRGVEEAESELRAKLDLHGNWRPLDMMAARVIDEQAEFLNVPVGTARLLVEAGVDDLLCEREVTVEPGDDEVEVTCDARREAVAGQVTVGGVSAGPGLLTWSRGDDGGDRESVIHNRETRGGLRQQSVVGGGRPEVLVEVSDDGTFRTDRLSPGRWTVTWRPASGASAPPRTVEVPAGPVRDLTLAFPGHGLTGSVVDESGDPVGRAVVRELMSGTFTVSAADGSFRMTGLEPGPLRLQARDGARYSQVADVLLEADRAPDPIRLEISRRHPGSIPVRVWTEAGHPGDGAFLFVEGEGQGRVHLVTADPGGQAEVTVPAPYPPRLRVAVHHEGRWHFGGWLDWQAARQGVEVELAPTGSLVVRSEEAAGPLRLTTGDGWDVGRLLGRLGTPPRVSPESPVSIGGLPEGSYLLEMDNPGSGLVGAGGVRVSVEAGRREEAVIRSPGF